MGPGGSRRVQQRGGAPVWYDRTGSGKINRHRLISILQNITVMPKEYIIRAITSFTGNAEDDDLDKCSWRFAHLAAQRGPHRSP